jgi:hypothetical protein
VQANCDALKIPFIEDALRWEPGSRNEVSWYDSGSWHDSLINSDGLKPQLRSHVDIENSPKRVREICEIVMPEYQHLFQFRLSAR